MKIIGDAAYLERYTPGYDYVSAWGSPESFSKHVGGINRKDCWHDAGWEHGEDWAGSKDMDTSLRMARTGWPEGATTVTKIRDRVLAQNPIRKQPIKYGIAGSTPNVPRAVSGDPLSMRADEYGRNKRKPVITLVCNMSANCGVEAITINNRAAAIAAVVDQIESVGYSVEVVTTATSHRGNFKAVTSILVKQSHHPVDIGRLAFGLGQTSMFRRMVFADWGFDKACEALGRGLGHSGNDAVIDGDNGHLIFKVPSAEGVSKYFKDDTTTATDGVKYLVDFLRSQDCPAFPKMTKDEKEAFNKPRSIFD